MKGTDTPCMRRRGWTPLGLGLIGASVLWLAGCQHSTSVVDVTLNPTHRPTVTVLPPTATQRPSATPTPLPTSTATASPPSTLPPALAPATPPAGDRSEWRLVPWTAEQADRLIAQTASQLQALEDDPNYGSVYGGKTLESLYGLLGLAEEEALLRFPDAPQAERWRWDLAYNQSIANVDSASDQAPELTTYAALLSDALNMQQATVESLPVWFTSHETRLDLAVTPVESVAEAALVTIDGMAYFWITHRLTGYTVIGLQSNLFYYREAGSSHDLIDLTGDGQPEVVVRFSESNCCGFGTQHAIYEVTTGYPVRLGFVGPTRSFVSLASTGDSAIQAFPIVGPDDQPGLIFDATYGDPFLDPCSIRRYDRYRWTGREFVWTETQHDLLPPNQYDDVAFCREARALAENDQEVDVVAQAAGGHYEMAAQTVLPLRVRFRLAEYRARLGQTETAKTLLESLLAIPEGDEPEAGSPWREAAQVLLDDLHTDQPFLASCSRILLCDWSAALTHWIGVQPTLRADQLAPNLQAEGVDLRASGLLALPSGGQPIVWWVVRNPHTGQREFWLVAQVGDHFSATYVAAVAQDHPRVTLHYTGDRADFYVVGDGQGSSLFQIRMDADSGMLVTGYGSVDRTSPEPDLVREAQFDAWRDALLEGQEPEVIREGLQDLRAELSCPGQPICATVDYWMGLASELLGDERAAVEAYGRAWDEAPDQLHAVWIRLKLGLAH